MAYKTFLFVLLAVVYVNGSETNDLCPCNDLEVKDYDALWDFMKTLSIDVPKEEKDIYTVLPSELSPLIDCGCEENNRKKRTIVKNFEDALAPLSNVKETKSRRIVDANCPLGLIKIGLRCVEVDYLDYENMK